MAVASGSYATTHQSELSTEVDGATLPRAILLPSVASRFTAPASSLVACSTTDQAQRTAGEVCNSGKSLLPPKPAPISAPEVDWFTFTIPQSDPAAPHHSNIAFMSLRESTRQLNCICVNVRLSTHLVNKLEDKPCLTLLFSSIASSRVLKVATSAQE